MGSWSASVLLLALAAAATDLRGRVIPRWLTVPAVALGLGYHAVAGGFLSSLAATALGLGLGLALMQVRAFGGGDAKWLAAAGALLGLKLWFYAVNFGLIAAGLTAVAQMAARGRLVFLAADCGAVVRGLRRHGWQPVEAHSLESPGAITAPFGVSLAIGIALALWAG